jgi:cystathionine beta-synthase
VVTLVCDTGSRYLSKVYNDSWVVEQGLMDRELHGDLRDLIARAATAGDAVTVGPEDTLLTAYNRMRQADVSQLPVMDDGRLIGLVDESDLLEAVEDRRQDARFRQPVATAMTAKLNTLQANEPLDRLLPIFERDQVAIVMDGKEFLGLITRIDLINYLRRAA